MSLFQKILQAIQLAVSVFVAIYPVVNGASPTAAQVRDHIKATVPDATDGHLAIVELSAKAAGLV